MAKEKAEIGIFGGTGIYDSGMLGIPSNAESGVWQIKVQSGLDHKEVEINVATNSS